MKTVKKILEHLKTMSETEQNEVLEFVEYLRNSTRLREQNEQDSEWGQFTLESAMARLAEEPSLYGLEDIRERFQ
jgi:hypothetical protein